VLSDADSFFASCERVFHPELAGRPVVVLSNNDGCVVALSSEAKRLGIANGTPWFTIRGQATVDGVVARSSNYQLYASLSARMMRMMSRRLAGQEIYSIDECFLVGFADTRRTMDACIAMRDEVATGLGIPLTVSVAPTRTLAKVESHWAKHDLSLPRIVSWDALSQRTPDLLNRVPVEEVWGIGRRLTRRLNGLGVASAGDLSRLSPSGMRHEYGVTMQRTILELNGLSSIKLFVRLRPEFCRTLMLRSLKLLG
jgi:DNA polymerase V